MSDNYNRFNIIILGIIFIALFIRAMGISSAYFADESMWTKNVMLLHNGIFDPTKYVPHPPLAVLSYYITTSLLGVNITGMRAMPLIAGTILMYVTYLFSKEIYNRKTAIITLALMAFSFYSVWSSLYIDMDGSLLALFIAATLFSYFKFKEGKDANMSWLVLSGIFFGLAILTKYPALFIIPILLLFEFSGRTASSLRSVKNISLIIRPVICVLFIGGLIFSIFPITSFLAGHPEMFNRTVAWGERAMTESFSLQEILISLLKTVYFSVQYTTPLIPAMVLFSLRDRAPKERLLFLWIAVYLIFYTFILPGKVKIRYLMLLIPPIYMLTAKSLAKFLDGLDRKDLFSMAVLIVLSASIIISLNQYGTYDVFNSQKTGILPLLDNGLIWYGGLGSSPFTIHTHSFIFVAIAGMLLSATMLSRKNHSKIIFFSLLAISIAFNSFILFQSFYPTVGPNYTNTLKEIAFDLKDIKEPLYSHSSYETALNAYFGDERVSTFRFGDKGKLVLLDVQLFEVPAFGAIKNYIRINCSLLKIYYSNNYPLGYIYNC